MVNFCSCFALTKQPASLFKREPGCLIYKYTKYLPVLQFTSYDLFLLIYPEERCLRNGYLVKVKGRAATCC